MERNTSSFDEDDRNTTRFIVEKGRMAKRSGPVGTMKFDKNTWTLKEK